MMGFTIPKAGKNAMKRMAVNEMSLLDAGFGNHAVALDPVSYTHLSWMREDSDRIWIKYGIEY